LEIREYLKVLRRRAWIPLLLVVVTVAATTLAVYLSKPEYAATATVIAKSPTSSTNSLSFQEVVVSNTVALQVRKELQLDKSAADLSAAVKANASKSNAYAITYTDANADLAVAVADRYANDAARAYQQLGGAPAVSIVKSTEGDLQTYRDRYLAAAKATQAFRVAHPDVVSALDAAAARANGTGDLSKPPAKVDQNLAAQYQLLVLDEHVVSQAYQDLNVDISKARIDELNNAKNWEATVVDQAVAKPDTSSRLLKVAYAAVVAVILGIALVFALNYLDNTVREPEEAEAIVGAPVIGIIPRGTARALKPARGGAA
jgi:capsular polysaccharide biosynthesis protein